jgi:hypothetical protein
VALNKFHHGFNMPARPRSKSSAFFERGERLRTARAAAQKLRSAFPTTTLVNVQLRFLPATAPLHAEQSFVLYPGAQAYFAYPCPYGDCDGIYDLNSEVNRTLGSGKATVSDTIECAGTRSRDGLPAQPCGLRVSYTITAQYEPERAPH